ncbi:MAG TPA: shikimate dehydrogenase [Pyrinomonadaceae bacterium]|jgi:3-dehydroquinate dehydratase/shikimate dehydrogenase|nr:shikimate dehydrogenase [Pyrinomonadaceae bacterium]
MREAEHVRVCVPVCVRHASELRRGVAHAAEVAAIIELRLDCLDEDQLDPALSQLPQLFAETPRPFINTFRPAEQGGRRALDAAARIALWEKLVALLRGGEARGGALFDIELDLFESPHGGTLLKVFGDLPEAGRLGLICSHHDFQRTPADLEKLFERMARTPARVLKMATRAEDITDCIAVLRLLEPARRVGREVIAVAMGEAGLLTRVLAPSRGAFLTYGSLDAAQATAPGQVGARELRELYRVHEITDRTLVTGLVGSPVSHSFSKHMHNAAFAARGLDAVFIPFEVADVFAFARRMAHPRTRELRWNLRGLSVTAPHKQAITAHLDWVEPKASEVGAVNTVVVEGDELLGYNTDAEAALKPLDGLMELNDARVAVIGAGGAARALLWDLQRRGARATVFARDPERARTTADDFDARAAALEGASFEGFDLVVNATPLGTRGARQDETPATSSQLRGARVAYDLVYNPPLTRFMRAARAAGCETIGGLRMLVAQAAEQFKLWTRTDAPVEVMRAAAEKVVVGD